MKKWIIFILVFTLIIPFVNSQDCDYECQLGDYESGVCRAGTQPTSKLHHCMWLFPYEFMPWEGHYPGGLGNHFEDPQILINNLEGLQIDCLIVHGGEWQADGSIHRDPNKKGEEVTPLMWTNFINAIKAWDPNVKVLVWVTTVGGFRTDLSDPVKRETMYNSVITLLNEAPFDGYNEDYEGWGWIKNSTGQLVWDRSRLVHLRTFYQGIINTVKAMNKIATVATEVNWGGYTIEDYTYLLEGFDYNMPMFYGHIVYYDTNSWNKILQYSPCPVNMGLSVWNSVFDKDTWTYKITFDQQLAWVDTQSHDNLAGIAIWCYDHMSYEDLDTWKNWPTKDTIGS